MSVVANGSIWMLNLINDDNNNNNNNSWQGILKKKKDAE
jgi:hypothetical protein